VDAAKTVVQAFILSHLEYCNSLSYCFDRHPAVVTTVGPECHRPTGHGNTSLLCLETFCLQFTKTAEATYKITVEKCEHCHQFLTLVRVCMPNACLYSFRSYIWVP